MRSARHRRKRAGRHALREPRAARLGRAAAFAVLAGAVFLVAAWGFLGSRESSPPLLPPPQDAPDPGLEAPVRLGILFGGDVLLDLEPGAILAAEGPEALLPGWLALRRRPAVDLAFANLECPLSLRGSPWEGKRFTFRADPVASAGCLLVGGFDALGLANNHALDFGREALGDTIAALREAGIASAGAGEAADAYAPVFLECRGVHIALLAFCDQASLPGSGWPAQAGRPGVAVLTPLDRALASVAAAREQADLVVVSCHWGLEYYPVTSEQVKVARALVDAGADLVYGHHPHIPQGVEVYRGRPILYSLGNLVFHPFQPRARGMSAALVRWAQAPDGTLVAGMIEVYPLYNDGGRTVTMPEELAAEFLEEVARQSAALGTGFTVAGDRLVHYIQHPDEPWATAGCYVPGSCAAA